MLLIHVDSKSTPPTKAGVGQVDRADMPTPGLPPYDVLYSILRTNHAECQFENFRNDNYDGMSYARINNFSRPASETRSVFLLISAFVTGKC